MSKLTAVQKRQRLYARREGKKAIAAINASIHPVYDGDAEHFENLAAMYARSACRYAAMSEQDKGDHA